MSLVPRIPWDVETSFAQDNGLGGSPGPYYCILACEQWNSPLYCDSEHPQVCVTAIPRCGTVPHLTAVSTVFQHSREPVHGQHCWHGLSKWKPLLTRQCRALPGPYLGSALIVAASGTSTAVLAPLAFLGIRLNHECPYINVCFWCCRTLVTSRQPGAPSQLWA